MDAFYASASLGDEIEANPALTTDGRLYTPVFDTSDNYTGFKAV